VVFEGEEALERGLYFVLLPPDNVFLDIAMGDDQTLSVAADASDLMGTAKVKGSAENELLYEVIRFIGKSRERSEKIEARYGEVEEGSEEDARRLAEQQALTDDVLAFQDRAFAKQPDSLVRALLLAGREPQVPADLTDGTPFEWYRGHYWDLVDFGEPGLLRSPTFEAKLLRYVDELTVQTPEDLKEATSELFERASVHPEVYKATVILMVNKYAKTKVMCQDAVYVHMVDEVYASGKAVWAEDPSNMIESAHRLRPTLCGATAPEIRARDGEGKSRRLSEVESDYVVVWFYDPDCGHCKKLGPKLAQFNDVANIELFTVNIAGERAPWLTSLESWGVQGGTHVTPVVDREGTLRPWDVRSTPKAFVIGPDGTIIGKQISIEQILGLVEHHAGERE
ncbi:MAG: DUF5106 domain-containing protein, partial [Proteobacteria bacterium]|nr:DUF5106 domain-containing protein [Pseudomonadota bacterium]